MKVGDNMQKWNEIRDEDSLKEFMEKVSFFHDSCIKEMHYLSGAYVNENMDMYPVNDRRILRVIIQRQYEEDSMIEMEFQGLKYLKLFPADEHYTCEILGSNIILKEDRVIWSDCEDKTDLEDGDTGTLVCASKLRWRPISGCMGEKEFLKDVDINHILDMLNWNNSAEIQAEGRRLAEHINCLSIFMQPMGERYNKNIWENCALILSGKKDALLEPYLPELLDWIRDLNWPGAMIILERLKRFRNYEWLSCTMKEKIEIAYVLNAEQWLDNLFELFTQEELKGYLEDEYCQRLYEEYLNDTNPEKEEKYSLEECKKERELT